LVLETDDESGTEEAVTETCPTLEEVLAAEVTLTPTGEEARGVDVFTDKFTGTAKNLHDEIEGHGLGLYPTLMQTVCLDDQNRPIDSTSFHPVRLGEEVMIGFTELFQSVSGTVVLVDLQSTKEQSEIDN
jgi:hypothetical protein